MMHAYTAMSDDALKATVDALPDRYDMSLTRTDMGALLTVLQDAYMRLSVTTDADMRNMVWLADFVSGVASTVGIEHV